MNMNFEYFQIQKCMLQTVRAEKWGHSMHRGINTPSLSCQAPLPLNLQAVQAHSPF